MVKRCQLISSCLFAPSGSSVTKPHLRGEAEDEENKLVIMFNHNVQITQMTDEGELKGYSFNKPSHLFANQTRKGK